MLDLLPGASADCERVSRRSFLQIGSLAGLGLSLPQLLAARSAHAATSTNPTRDVNCIMIWTHGGTSHHDTLDPKPNAPLAVRGEFGFIDTAVPGVQFTDVCPRLAKELKRYAVLRSWNPQNGSHGHADSWVMSGRQFNPAVEYPCYGSVVSHLKGFKTAMPPFVQLGNSLDRRFGGGTAGLLGLAHNPFEMLADPSAAKFTVRDITPPAGVASERIDRRKKMLGRIDELQRRADIQPAAFDALDVHFKAAFNMVTAPETKKAFAIEEEPQKLRDAYGKHRFGQSCLLARRLIQSGVRFVTITDPAWDTHQDNFNSIKKSRMPPVDEGLPQLLIDLEEQGMLDSTLVVWLTDFGRTPQVNSASGRDHWASAGFIVMAGAGVPGGHVLGATDEEGSRPTRDEYLTDDVAATIYAKLGIPLDLHANAPDGRPIRLIEGRVIQEWM
jgi:hypothetical protein